MNLERIGASHPLFEASFTLYEASFPPNERRTREDHLRALQDADFFPLGAVEDGKLLADVFLWETEDFCYLEHFAVQPGLRGQGTGSELLRQLLPNRSRKVFLQKCTLRSERDFIRSANWKLSVRILCHNGHHIFQPLGLILYRAFHLLSIKKQIDISEEIADMQHISAAHISRWEKNIFKPKYDFPFKVTVLIPMGFCPARQNILQFCLELSRPEQFYHFFKIRIVH